MAFKAPATQYASRYGFQVFPLRPGEKTPATRHGFKDATTDPLQLDEWWDENPAYNIGLATGEASGVWVFDIDMKEHDGEAEVAKLEALHGPLPVTPEQSTGQGAKGVGRQIFFRWPDGLEVRNSAGKLAPGLDVRGNGGYVVLAPSIHPSKRPYAWHQERRPSKIAFADAPQWLLDLVTKKPAQAPSPAAAPPPRPPSADGHPYSQKALDEEVRRVATCPPGSQSDTLMRAAFKVGQHVGAGTLRRSEAESALVEAGLQMVCSDGPWTRDQLQDHVSRGIAAGEASPRDIPERQAPKPRLVASREELPPHDPETGEVIELATAAAAAKRKPREPREERAQVALPDWMLGLPWVLKDDGNLKPGAIQNVGLMIEHHTDIKDTFRRNLLTDQVCVERPLPGETAEGFKPRSLTDDDEVTIARWMNNRGLFPSVQMVAQAVRQVASSQGYDPLTEWLGGLQWDGKERLDRWLIDCAGAEDSPYVRAVGRKYLMSAAARGLTPGAKVDTMLVLEGPQGLGKSSLALVLFGEDWFSDQVGDVTTKESAIQIQGCWCVEISEMDQFDRATENAVKAFLSQREDKYRPPYGRNAITRPRRCVFWGTINPVGIGYLRDPTGGRRFWPVEAKAIDLEYTARAREQLWAEAVARIQAGERWWLEDDEVAAAEAEQQARQAGDPWDEAVARWLEDQLPNAKFTNNEVVSAALNIPIERRDFRVEKRVGAILTRLHCIPTRYYLGGMRHRGWLRPALTKSRQ